MAGQPGPVGRFLLGLYAYPAMLLGLGCLAALCLLWLPFAVILQPLLPRRWGQPLGRRTIMATLRFYLRFLEIFCFCRFDICRSFASDQKRLDALSCEHLCQSCERCRWPALGDPTRTSIEDHKGSFYALFAQERAHFVPVFVLRHKSKFGYRHLCSSRSGNIHILIHHMQA